MYKFTALNQTGFSAAFMKKTIVIVLFYFLYVGTGCNTQGDNSQKPDSLYTGEKFNEHVRTTAFRTPAEEKAGFRLPPGFEIELYASEPDIGKPINFAFDSKGRMWVSQSFEYPFAAAPGKGKDRVSILEDTDGDGKADKFTHFDDTLNIPIGILPVQEGAIAFSIPNVIKYTDADGDGKPESQQQLFGPFEYKDTHGMVNNFAEGYDGWVYGCHGFTNRSNVAGADGDTIHLVSGNTIRFKKDGSRIEHHTHGRINPFGLAFDELGYLYSTDCHTSPLYQLIRGGDYMQWGKEEGMGFAPDMKPMENEATALAGIAYYADVHFPEAYRSNFYIGDVVASRVYRNSFHFEGSSPVGKKEADFILSEDPWFRPVDVKLGPDGALYIADFYNSIIGHYEVPLDHPKRDRVSGRIWRVTYKGKAGKPVDWTQATVQELLKALNADNIRNRMTAASELADRIGKDAVTPVKERLNDKDISPREYVLGLWVLHRLGAVNDDMIRAAAVHPDTAIRVHVLRILAEQQVASPAGYTIAANALGDDNPHVQRAAVELMGRYIHADAVHALVAFRKKVPDYDTHMIYTIRLTLRNMLRHKALMNEVTSRQWPNEDVAVLSTVLVGVQTPVSASFLYRFIKQDPKIENRELGKAFAHIARFIPQNELPDVFGSGMAKGKNDKELDFLIYEAIRDGMVRRDNKASPAFTGWGNRLALGILTAYQPTKEDRQVHKINVALDVIGKNRVPGTEESVVKILKDTSNRNDTRYTALRALLRLNPGKNIPLVIALLNDDKTNSGLKRDLVNVAGEFPGNTSLNILGAVKNAEPDLQYSIAVALAGSSAGKDILLGKVRAGEIFPRFLIQPNVEERMSLGITKQQQVLLEELTANLQDISKERQELIQQRVDAFRAASPKPSADAGRAVFTRNCSPCHSIGNDGGGMIGPQLNSVGKWGVNALAEKILDPNRNISESFRTYTIRLKDGKVMTGLFRREEGAATVYADATGREFTVVNKEVAERTASKYTLMPDQFGEMIPPEDFTALMTYLLTVQD